jgi:ketosteroid isomerase-like protein
VDSDPAGASASTEGARPSALLARVSRRRGGRANARSIEERLALAIPAPVLRLAIVATQRLAPGSNLRRRLLKRIVRRGIEGAARDDFEFAERLFEPDVELRMFGDIARSLGLAEQYRGHQGYRDVWRDYKLELDDLRYELKQLIDLGDRIALRAVMVGRGRTSGVITRRTQGFIYTMSSRGVARQDIYWTWQEALAALDAGGPASRPAEH